MRLGVSASFPDWFWQVKLIAISFGKANCHLFCSCDVIVTAVFAIGNQAALNRFSRTDGRLSTREIHWFLTHNRAHARIW
jgi:hypothetical protein